MTPTNEDIQSSLSLIEKDFKLDESYFSLSTKESISYDEAFLMIMRVVEDLLTNDFNGLLNALYRIDVSEQKLKEALAEGTDNPASIITQMIIERELQKVETRKRYS